MPLSDSELDSEGDLEDLPVDLGGLYKFNSSARYEGEYIEGKRHGIGLMIYPDGSRYEGGWVENVKQGHGVYYYVNGDKYDGFWIEDQRHGIGTYTFYETNTSVSYHVIWCPTNFTVSRYQSPILKCTVGPASIQ